VVTVASVTILPAITNAECGSPLTLAAVAAGTPPLTYQWFDNQTNLVTGATNATLTLANVSSSQAGNYTVQVANNFGNATASAAVTVSDTTAPVITLMGPSPMTVECHGSFADPGATALDACVGPVAVVASGTVDTNTTGTYTLTYLANDGNGNTATAFRTVNVADTTAPAVSWSFTNLTVSADTNCQALMPDVTGTNYILAADACSSVVTITQTPTNSTVLPLGTNEVILAITDGSGNTAWSTNTIVVADTTAPQITTQPQSLTNLLGVDAVFTVQAVSCSALAYQWSYGTNVLADQTNATLTVPNVQLADAGSYQVTVASAAGVSTSAVAVLTVNRAPIAGSTNGGDTENQALVISTVKLLSVCSDPDGDPLTVIAAGPLSTNGGTVTLTDDNVTYVPAADFVGTDRFDFTVSDSRGGSATGSVLVTVTSATAPPLNIVSGPEMLENGHFYVGFAGLPGYSYTVQCSANADGPWTTLTNLTAGANGLFDFEDTTEPAPPTRFYRTTYP